MLADSAVGKKTSEAALWCRRGRYAMRTRRGRAGIRHPALPSTAATGTLIDTAPFPVPAGRVVLEDSPSPVYGAALLMRFGSDPIRGSNPRSSAARGFPVFGLSLIHI